MEIRQGAGGDEGAIFAGDLFRMYQRYCEGKGWKIEVISMNEGIAGGLGEVSFEVTGESVCGIKNTKVVCIEFKGACHGESRSRSYFSRTRGSFAEAEDVDVDLDMKDVKRIHIVLRVQEVST